MFLILMCLILLGVFGYILYSRSKYRNKENGVPFFFENDRLVLNSLVPYSAEIREIDYVELDYNPENLDKVVSNFIAIILVQKDGTKKKVQYKVNRENPADHPDEMARLLKEKGIHCITP